MKVIAILFGFILLGALMLLWIRIDQDDKERASRSRIRSMGLESEFRIDRIERDYGDKPSPKPISTMIDIATDLARTGPPSLVRLSISDISYDVFDTDTPPWAWLAYYTPENRKVRMMFRWEEDHYVYISHCYRQTAFFYSDERNETGTKTDHLEPAMREFLARHNVAMPEISPVPNSPKTAATPLPITPNPLQRAAETRQREALDIARKYASPK